MVASTHFKNSGNFILVSDLNSKSIDILKELKDLKNKVQEQEQQIQFLLKKNEQLDLDKKILREQIQEIQKNLQEQQQELKEWKQKYDQKDQELQQVKDQLKYITKSIEHAFKNSLQAKNLSVAMAHVQQLLQKTSPLYQEYCVEELQEILQKNGFYNRVSLPLDKTKSYKSNQLEFTLKKYFLENRSKRSIKMKEALSSWGLDPKTIRKVFRNLVTHFPMVFSFEKVDVRNKALCLLNRDLFHKMMIHW